MSHLTVYLDRSHRVFFEGRLVQDVRFSKVDEDTVDNVIEIHLDKLSPEDLASRTLSKVTVEDFDEWTSCPRAEMLRHYAGVVREERRTVVTATFDVQFGQAEGKEGRVYGRIINDKYSSHSTQETSKLTQGIKA